jgi:SAM-dependent methyltransferase
MARTEPFDTHSSEYEAWFEDNRFAFLSELEAVRVQLAAKGRSVEIGVGTGRFAIPLGIDVGVEPSIRMRKIAERKGIRVVDGIGENLPFEDAQFDIVLMVTTLCFLDDVETAFAEAYRILENGGHFVIGFIDKDSRIGRLYQQNREKSLFYKVATFYSVKEIVQLLRQTGFRNISFTQTIFRDLPEITNIEPIKSGFGEGSFVVVKGEK